MLQTSAYQLQNLFGSTRLTGKKGKAQEKSLELIESINPGDIFVYFCNIIWGLLWDKISGRTGFLPPEWLCEYTTNSCQMTDGVSNGGQCSGFKVRYLSQQMWDLLAIR